ncbi:MAG: FtsQ-type POTRA domain-containing protein [Actinomycetota bacterium]|nr:FtsQ-type POTRA domain-containing protein [Actinomycetota bacterium]
MTATLSSSSVGRFRAAARRRRWRSGRVVVTLLLAITLVGGVAYVAVGTGLLAVRTVRVTGNHQVSAAAVLAAAQVPVGTPMVLLDGAPIRRRVLADVPGITAVDVVRSWPSGVRLVVRERVAVAVIAQAGRFVLVDRSAVLFRTVDRAPPGVVLIEVARPGQADPATRAALAVLVGLPADLRALVDAVAAPTAEQVTLRLHGGRDVLWGDAQDSRDKVAVVRVLLRRSGRHIDVSSPGLVTIR